MKNKKLEEIHSKTADTDEKNDPTKKGISDVTIVICCVAAVCAVFLIQGLMGLQKNMANKPAKASKSEQAEVLSETPETVSEIISETVSEAASEAVSEAASEAVSEAVSEEGPKADSAAASVGEAKVPTGASSAPTSEASSGPVSAAASGPASSEPASEATVLSSPNEEALAVIADMDSMKQKMEQGDYTRYKLQNNAKAYLGNKAVNVILAPEAGSKYDHKGEALYYYKDGKLIGIDFKDEAYSIRAIFNEEAPEILRWSDDSNAYQIIENPYSAEWLEGLRADAKEKYATAKTFIK